MRWIAGFTLCILVLHKTAADLYLHSLRGSNNRLNEATATRANANRVFDSQVGKVYRETNSHLYHFIVLYVTHLYAIFACLSTRFWVIFSLTDLFLKGDEGPHLFKIYVSHLQIILSPCTTFSFVSRGIWGDFICLFCEFRVFCEHQSLILLIPCPVFAIEIVQFFMPSEIRVGKGVHIILIYLFICLFVCQSASNFNLAQSQVIIKISYLSMSEETVSQSVSQG